MNEIFDEWDAYALKKNLIPRALDPEKILRESALKIVALTGIRRCGKSSALILLRQKLAQEGKKAAYLNLEDSRIKDSPSLLDEILKWFGDCGYLLLDEITSAADWEGWLSRNHEMLKGRLNLVISSSRSSLARPSKPLRGRISAHELGPLSLAEFLKFIKIQVEPTTAGTGRWERGFSDYLIYGGFPEAALTADKTDRVRLIASYFRDIVGLDVAEISSSEISAVDTFGKYIIEAPYFSASKCLRFFQTLGHKIGKSKLLQLEKYAQDSYLFFFVPIFSHTIKDRAQYPRKAYLGDTGFLYAISGRTDLGRLFENAVYLELRRRLSPVMDLHYWKDKYGAETDFVVREGLRAVKIIQACYSIKDKKTEIRETRGLVACARELGLSGGTIVTVSDEGEKTIEGVKIRFVPFRKWLATPGVR